jgi:Putative beta-barrel porin 2
MPTTRSTRRILGAIRLGCVVAAFGAATIAQAQTHTWSVDIGAYHSDNIARTSINEESDTVAEVGARLDLQTTRPRLDANIDLNVGYRDYLEDTFDNEAIGGLDGILVYGLVPERFTWLLQDNFGQVANDARQIDTPLNRQNFNYFTTGPDFIFHMGARTGLTLQGRWSDVYYENTGENSNRQLRGALILAQEIAEARTVSLNLAATRVEYDEVPPGSDYDVQEAYLRFDATGQFTTLATDLGYTVLHDNGESNDGLLARISLTRKVATRSSISAEAGTEFADAANIFQLDQSFGGVRRETDGALASSDAYETDYIYLSWQTSGTRTTVALSGNWRDESHEEQTDLNRTYLEGRIDLSRRLGSRVTISLLGGYDRQDYDEPGLDLDEWSAEAGLEWRVQEFLSLLLRLTHFEGSATSGDYEENRIYLGLRFAGGDGG